VSATPTEPQLLKAGFLVLDAATGALHRIVPFQYNPGQLVHSVGHEGETFACVVEYDATDALAAGDALALERGLAPQLAALREIADDHPDSVIVFVWGPSRVAPVAFLSLVVAETMFDERLNPVAATVTLELRVAADGDASQLAVQIGAEYERSQEELANLAPPGTLAALGLDSLP